MFVLFVVYVYYVSSRYIKRSCLGVFVLVDGQGVFTLPIGFIYLINEEVMKRSTNPYKIRLLLAVSSECNFCDKGNTS